MTLEFLPTRVLRFFCSLDYLHQLADSWPAFFVTLDLLTPGSFTRRLCSQWVPPPFSSFLQRHTLPWLLSSFCSVWGTGWWYQHLSLIYLSPWRNLKEPLVSGLPCSWVDCLYFLLPLCPVSILLFYWKSCFIEILKKYDCYWSCPSTCKEPFRESSKKI